MSEELHNCLEPEKFNLIAKDCKNTIDKYSLYYTKYNIIKVKNKTVNKSIEKIKNNENVLIFFNKRMESNGIYYILKETKVPLVFVHKNLIKKNDSKFKYEILKYRGMEYDIKYNIIKDYDTNKTPEEFMSWIKEKLFSSQI